MGLSRSRRDGGMIWAGFVDAMTTLLMVLLFVLTIFTVMQSMLRDTITTQSNQLTELNDQMAQLADALGLERNRSAELTAEIGTLRSSLSSAQAEGERQAAQIAGLTQDLAGAQGQIASFEAQVASLLAERDRQAGQIGALTASVTDLQAAQSKLITEKEALDLALAKARDEVSAGEEAARLAAARREALEVLIADMKKKVAAGEAELATAQTELSEAEKVRLTDLAAAEALRERLKTSDAELTAMTLALEEQRKRAEETLTLLAAAQAASRAAEGVTANKDVALAEAERILTERDQEILKSARDMALLNQQMTALRTQLGTLQAILDASADKDRAAKVQIEALGSQLNAALAQVAAEQKRRADLEEAEKERLAAEKERLAAENVDLAKYRSEFFGQISQLLAGQPGVRVVGDRFVFDSEVLFNPGSADLAPEGAAQIARVVETLRPVVDRIPEGINWIIRVDGHTDNVPLSGTGEFADNWELSQGRALSVVKFMQESLGFPAERLAAAGFGEFQPVAEGDAPEALAQNRRIELKLTER